MSFHFLLSLGLGTLFIRASSQLKLRTWGISFLFGHYTSVLMLYALGILGLSLKLSAQLTFALALLSLATFLMQKAEGRTLKTYVHPIFLIFPLIILFTYLYPAPFRQYYGVDETSHWLLMPSMMLEWDTITTLSFPYKFYAHYTPGWPLTILLPSLIQNRLIDESQLIYAPLFSGLSLCAMFFDTGKLLWAKFKAQVPLENLLFLGIPLLLAHALKPFGQFFDSTFALEIAQTQAFIALFTCLFLWDNKLISDRRSWLYLAILLAINYLLKKPSIVVTIPVLLAIFMHHHPIHKNLRSLLINLIACLLPLALVMFSWSQATQGMPTLVDQTNSSSFLSQRPEILPLMLKRLFTDFLIDPRAILGVLACAMFLRLRTTRKTCVLLLITYLIYFFGLWYLYVVKFYLQQAMELASFDRYLSVPQQALQTMGAAGLIYLTYLIWQKFKSRLPDRAWIQFLCLLNIISLGLIFIILIKRTELFKSYPSNIVKRDAPQFLQIVAAFPHKNPKVLILDQDQAYGSITDVQMHGFSKAGPLYSLYNSHQWKRESYSDQALTEVFKQQDIIWIIHTAPWIDTILEQLTQTKCKQPFPQYFLIKLNGNYECQRKRVF